MNPVTMFLVTIAGIFLLGALGEAVFRRTNVPDVVWLIFAGIIIGPVGGLVTREQLVAVAPYFAALTLVIVLFEGGSKLKLLELTTAAPRSGALALLTFAVSAIAVTLLAAGLAGLGWLPPEWGWMHSLLLGCILGGSSSIIIMPAMAQAKVRPSVANLVNLESAFTDAFCVVGASALTALLTGGAGGESPGVTLARSFGIGLLAGGGAGLLWLIFSRALRESEHAYPITLSVLFLLYVAIERAGGSAALGILTFAIFAGNARRIGAKAGVVGGAELRADVRGFHSQMTFIVKSFFFTFIGAMLGPPWTLIALGVVLGVALVAARIPGAWLATLGGQFSRRQRALVIVCAPRGMAAGVLATIPPALGIPGTQPFPTIVFACVLTTILAFAVGFPWVRRGDVDGELVAAEGAPAAAAVEPPAQVVAGGAG